MKRNNKQWDIKAATVLAGAFHFLYYCGRACLMPFLTLYLRHLGLSAYMVGIVMGTRHLISLIWHPLSSLLAKHYDKQRTVIIGSLACSAALGLAFLLLPPAGGKVAAVGVCNATSALSTKPTVDYTSSSLQADHTKTTQSGKAAASVTSKARQTTSPQHPTRWASPVVPDTEVDAGHSITPVSHNSSKHAKTSVSDSLKNSSQHVKTSPSVSDSLEKAESPTKQGIGEHSNKSQIDIAQHSRTSRSEKRQKQDEEEKVSHVEFLGSLKAMDAEHQLFFLVLFIMALWELASAPLDWVADDGLYEYLDFVDATDHYGRVWMWRLLGGACGVFAAGLLVSSLDCFLFSGARVPRSAVHFFAYTLLMLVAIPEATFFPLHLNRKQAMRRRGEASGVVKALRHIRADSRALLCGVTACLVGATSAAVEDFLPWQMQDHSGGELHVGAVLGLGLLAQVAFPPLGQSGRVSRLLGPHARLLLLGTVSRALQCLWYSFLLGGPWAVLPAQALDCLSVSATWWAIEAQCNDVASPGTERAVLRVYQALALDLGAGLGSFAGGLVVQRFGVAVLFQGLAGGLALWCLVLGPLQWKIPKQRRINYSRLLAANGSEGSESESDPENDWLEKAIGREDGNNNNNNNNNRSNVR